MKCGSFLRFCQFTVIISFNTMAYLKANPKKVIRMYGEKLASYMIEYGLGVSTFANCELKKNDNDYFGE
jgi:restriction endonuclease Mrr